MSGSVTEDHIKFIAHLAQYQLNTVLNFLFLIAQPVTSKGNVNVQAASPSSAITVMEADMGDAGIGIEKVACPEESRSRMELKSY